MSNVVSNPRTPTSEWTWTADVLAFAQKHGLAALLEPLRQATVALFPSMTELRIFVEKDIEYPEWQYIVFEAFVPNRDLGNYRELRRAWAVEWFRVSATPEVRGHVVLTLIPVDA